MSVTAKNTPLTHIESYCNCCAIVCTFLTYKQTITCHI